MKNENIKIGQKVIIIELYSGNSRLIETEITSVGNKYFTVQYRKYKFELDKQRDKIYHRQAADKYNHYICYVSKDDYELDKQHDYVNEIYRRLKDNFYDFELDTKKQILKLFGFEK